MYYLLVACLSLAVLLAANLVASALAATLWLCISGPAQRWSAAARSKVTFVLRFFPAIFGLVGIAALFIPSYVLYEPSPADEVVSLKLALIALLSLEGITIAVWRGFASWAATRRLVADWTSRAETLSVEGTSMPIFCLPHPFPLIAVVGVLRPRLFVSAHLIDLLGHKEVLAALKHEAGHLSARDNLKCLLMRGCRDLLGVIPLGRSLDLAWRKAAEAAADEYAARSGPSAALDLASALVGIARLVPEGAKPFMPASALLLGDDVDGVAGRVLRLTQLAEAGRAPDRPNGLILSAFTWSLFCTVLAAMAYAALNPHILLSLHAATEHLFPFLS